MLYIALAKFLWKEILCTPLVRLLVTTNSSLFLWKEIMLLGAYLLLWARLVRLTNGDHLGLYSLHAYAYLLITKMTSLYPKQLFMVGKFMSDEPCSFFNQFVIKKTGHHLFIAYERFPIVKRHCDAFRRVFVFILIQTSFIYTKKREVILLCTYGSIYFLPYLTFLGDKTCCINAPNSSGDGGEEVWWRMECSGCIKYGMILFGMKRIEWSYKKICFEVMA